MKFATVMLLAVLFAVPASADEVVVEIQGEVEYNQVNSGLFADVMSGDPVTITFTLDSDNYLDSDTYNTRGYVIDHASFNQTMGSVNIGLLDPYTDGFTPYFVLRDGDPVADGFIFSHGTDWPASLWLNEPGNLDDWFGSHFEVGYEGDVLSSLDILDAIGTYDYTGLTSFYFTVQDAWADAIGLIFTQMTISSSVATENSSWTDVKNLYR
jgi:hypothetical protein